MFYFQKKCHTSQSISPYCHLVKDYGSYVHYFKAGFLYSKCLLIILVKIYDFQIITFIYSSLTSLFIYELTKTHRRGSWAHIQCKADFYDTAYYIII